MASGMTAHVPKRMRLPAFRYAALDPYTWPQAEDSASADDVAARAA
jgi:hypothetical protein